MNDQDRTWPMKKIRPPLLLATAVLSAGQQLCEPPNPSVLLVRLAVGLLLIAISVLPDVANAHGVVGDRFFPATIATDDPFAADELALPTVTRLRHQDDGSTTRETDYEFDYSKSIFPGFAISFGGGYLDTSHVGGPTEAGRSNFSIAPTLELFRSPEHEFIGSVGVEWEIGGSGSKGVSESSSTYTPAIKFGK